MEEEEKEEDKEQVDDEDDSDHESQCHVCGEDGELICCDQCPKVYHLDCHEPPIRRLPRSGDFSHCLELMIIFIECLFCIFSIKHLQAMTYYVYFIP